MMVNNLSNIGAECIKETWTSHEVVSYQSMDLPPGFPGAHDVAFL